ncbi:hypothetical protein ACHAWU_005949 [Discostella pseudostelligera]|uniref:COX assembly mitochondrial protein n=1 Tax=Discostella pseudostelligera TaxID=259834 RepID=A0ABD3M8S4_9STRA
MPSSNNNDANDGVMDRLAKALFASPSSPLTAFADRQRVERLEQCQQLERILEECKTAARNNNGDELRGQSSAPDNNVRNSKSGARISRFFGWDSQSSNQQNGGNVLDAAESSIYDSDKSAEDGGEMKKIKTETISRKRHSEGCAIETHELWACRALAVGCGSHLAELRQCWADAERNLLVTSKTKEEEMEFYNDKSKDTLCRSIQLRMARCVNKNSAELNERVKAADQAQN